MKTDKIEKLKKSVAAYNRKVTKSNNDFEKMTAKEKRVTIARDVLMQIQSKRLIPKSGVWLLGVVDGVFEKDIELQKVLENVKECEGCALGGMFMCTVERANKLKISQLEDTYINCDQNHKNFGEITANEVSQNDIYNYMKRFFSKTQLDLIETTFELTNGGAEVSESVQKLATDFWADFCVSENKEDGCILDPEDRMRLIMENIVANNGTFVPTKKPLAVYKTPGYVG